MPLKVKYQRILDKFIDEYGVEKGTRVFYATARLRKWKID